MSGATQLLFGIKGKRWDDHPVISKLYNPAWVRPDETEGISNKENVRLASLTEKADIVQKYIQKNVERIKQIAEEQQRLADAETDINADMSGPHPSLPIALSLYYIPLWLKLRRAAPLHFYYLFSLIFYCFRRPP